MQVSRNALSNDILVNDVYDIGVKFVSCQDGLLHSLL